MASDQRDVITFSLFKPQLTENEQRSNNREKRRRRRFPAAERAKWTPRRRSVNDSIFILPSIYRWRPFLTDSPCPVNIVDKQSFVLMTKTDLTLNDIQEYHRRNIARCLTDIESLPLSRQDQQLFFAIGNRDSRCRLALTENKKTKEYDLYPHYQTTLVRVASSHANQQHQSRVTFSSARQLGWLQEIEHTIQTSQIPGDRSIEQVPQQPWPRDGTCRTSTNRLRPVCVHQLDVRIRSRCEQRHVRSREELPVAVADDWQCHGLDEWACHRVDQCRLNMARTLLDMTEAAVTFD